MKLSPTKAFLRDVDGLSQEHRDATIRCLEKFVDSPKRAGLNFEPVRTRKGYFTIRATRGVRVLLREVGKQEFDVVAVGNHDYIYGR